MAIDGSLNGATGRYTAIGHGIARLCMVRNLLCADESFGKAVLPLTDNLGGGARLEKCIAHRTHTHPVANEWKRNTKRSGKSGTRRFGTATGSESPCDTEGHEKQTHWQPWEQTWKTQVGRNGLPATCKQVVRKLKVMRDMRCFLTVKEESWRTCSHLKTRSRRKAGSTKGKQQHGGSSFAATMQE